jgi:hypothetical protein
MQVIEKSKVAFQREQMVFRDGRAEEIIAVYLVLHGVMTCKVGFLLAHLNPCARNYGGLIACVVAVYTNCCTNVVKHQKYWRNKGCCAARTLGEHVIM